MHFCHTPSPFPLLLRISLRLLLEAAAFFAQNSKVDTNPKAPSPFSVLVSAAIKGPEQKIFRHHDGCLAAEDIILLFDLLSGESRRHSVPSAHF